MNKLKKHILPFILLFLNTVNLFADIGNRGRWEDNTGTSDFGVFIVAIVAIGIGGLVGYVFIADGFKNGFKDKESNKLGCGFIIAAIAGLLFLVAMCSRQ